MDKSVTFSETFKGARDLFEEGMYRKALSKFETALTAAPDEESIIRVRFCIIVCHARLQQVSLAELFGWEEELTVFCFLSIRRRCVAVTNWSQW